MASIAPGRSRTGMDEESFEALVRAYHPLMLGLARALAPTAADAEAAVREAWQDVIGGLGALDDDAPSRAWILRLVTDRVAARRRGLDRPPVASHWADAGGDRGRALLSEAIEALADGERAVVRLRDVEGWSPREVCDALSMAADVQRVLLHRARTTLRDALYGAERAGAS